MSAITSAPRSDLGALAHQLDEHGIAGCEQSLQAVVRLACAVAIDAVLVDILADPTAPDVARMRAFGRIAVLLERRSGSDRDPALRAA